MKFAVCPVCHRTVIAMQDRDGFDRPKGHWWIGSHAGKKWGRPCDGERAEVEVAALMDTR